MLTADPTYPSSSAIVSPAWMPTPTRIGSSGCSADAARGIGGEGEAASHGVADGAEDDVEAVALGLDLGPVEPRDRVAGEISVAGEQGRGGRGPVPLDEVGVTPQIGEQEAPCGRLGWAICHWRPMLRDRVNRRDGPIQGCSRATRRTRLAVVIRESGHIGTEHHRGTACVHISGDAPTVAAPGPPIGGGLRCPAPPGIHHRADLDRDGSSQAPAGLHARPPAPRRHRQPGRGRLHATRARQGNARPRLPVEADMRGGRSDHRADRGLAESHAPEPPRRSRSRHRPRNRRRRSHSSPSPPPRRSSTRRQIPSGSCPDPHSRRAPRPLASPRRSR